MVAMVVHDEPVMTLTKAQMAQVDVGVYDLHAVIDQRGHHAAHHPCAAESANEQQYDQCARHARHILRYGFLKARPWHVEVAHAYEHTQRRHREERYL
mgnify:CR=1 FL=1